MQARMNNPAIAVPGAMDALQALSKAVLRTGVPETTLELMNLRASQINGCSVCLQMHARDLRKAGRATRRSTQSPDGGTRPTSTTPSGLRWR